MNKEVENLGKRLVEELEVVRDDYIKMKEERPFLIRKDVVAAELKDLLHNTDNLEQSLINYIENLLKI